MNVSMSYIESNRYLSIKNVKWSYRGEGNANLVLSLPKEKVILRMQKCEYNSIVDKRLIQKTEIKLIRDVQFHNTVMTLLLGKTFVKSPILVRIPENDIAEIDNDLFKFRPRYRLNKGIRFGLITCHPDFTHLPSIVSYNYLNNDYCDPAIFSINDNVIYCFEIKPKQGWIPPEDRHHPKCTFCSHQYLKFMKQRVNSISGYCPLDLFSGNSYRMKRALKSLLKTPQNNLKIFENGNLIYCEDSHKDYIEILSALMEPNSEVINSERLLDKWCALIHDALTMHFSEDSSPRLFLHDQIKDCENVHCSNQTKVSPLIDLVDPCDWASELLPENCVLHKILNVQKLQRHSFNCIYRMYSEVQDTEDDYAYVDKISESNHPLDPIQQYLLSATAKDCSIFIALRRCSYKIIQDHKLHYITDCDGINYQINIEISDIDPKPLSCIGKHSRRDSDVLAAVLFHRNDPYCY